MSAILPEPPLLRQAALSQALSPLPRAALQDPLPHHRQCLRPAAASQSRATVSRSTAARSTGWSSAFAERGELGLLDRREDNGDVKLDEAYLAGCMRSSAPAPKTTAGGGRPGRARCWWRPCGAERACACTWPP